MKFLFVTMLLISQATFSQALQQPLLQPNDEFLRYLNILDEKVSFSIENQTISKIELFKKMEDTNKNTFSEVMKKKIAFYEQRFFLGKKILKGERDETIEYLKLREKEFITFQSIDSLLFIRVEPILGVTFKSQYGSQFFHRWNGFTTYGYLGDNITFDLDFRDNLEQGNRFNKEKLNTNEPGINPLQNGRNYLDYSQMNASICYFWKWGTVSLRKGEILLGSGFNGKIIHSDKAPTYPHFLLQIYPNDWLAYSFYHGWLKSGLIDSNSIRYGYSGGKTSYSAVPKYIIGHFVTIKPSKKLNISVGESIIYSDKIEPLYLIPLLFLRPSDHYLSGKNSDTGDNAQIFFDVNYKIQSWQSFFYASFFIDELSIRYLLRGEKLSALGGTIGTDINNPFWLNSYFNLEYSRINPFVYMNANFAQTYTSNGYQLGHWIGSNADVISFNFTQFASRALTLKFFAEYFRKGKKELAEEQSQLPYPAFLYGSKRKESNIGLIINYEFLNDLFIEAEYQFSNISDENLIRTPLWMKGKKHSFGFSVGYGR